MKSAHTVTASRPIKGLVAFVPAVSMAAVMAPFGGHANAGHLAAPAGFQLDRDEDQVHPGEGSA